MEKHILCNGDSKTRRALRNASEEIVTATEADLPRILEIYDIAKALHAGKRQSEPVERRLSGSGDTADRH